MANNNNILFNAALSGFLQGARAGQSVVGTVTSGQVANVQAAAKAFATELDSLIATDTAISASGGEPLPPTTTVIIEGQLAKTGLVLALSSGFAQGKAGIDAVQTDYASAAAAIVVDYNAAVANMDLT